MGSIIELPPIRVHFLTTSKEGVVDLRVDHVWAHETLTLPLVPSSAVPEALPLLEPAIAHYVAQWPRFVVPDANETDAKGFWVAAGGLPEHVAPPQNWDRLSVVIWPHIPQDIKRWLGDKRPDAVYVADPAYDIPPDYSEFIVEATELGIEPWEG